ncbi:helix-turn-helix domain-containing protein [Streptomyces sp. DSM 41527]|uniref:Helix-turn-helix domain-containing protein n=1 Tax=Streptomyces mooreae TaxID=3075523 RepID=A0ABU2T521_9ACTN|nr:helix-turn-helix domain-containing protein [Streptomyces sp. DSM 41527]MDT0456093.1 helix-turn-helix domain-containing protein [Streptomyces sp. DSM 41527]
MYDHETRERALALLRQGVTNRVVAERLDVPRGTIGWWRHVDRKQRGETFERPHDCPRCAERPYDHKAYAYLLGLYLGDGHIISKPKQHHLSIFCADDWPGLIRETEKAMRNVMAMPCVKRRQKKGCVEVKSFTQHWTCMFPQHGRGKKHERPIILAPWQQRIVDDHPWEFLRGLIHSDGCRITNWTTRMVGGERKRYEYPRYFFSNKSDDIRRLCSDTLTKVGVEWTVLARGSDPFNISVARKASVALMDRHIGPKY